MNVQNIIIKFKNKSCPIYTYPIKIIKAPAPILSNILVILINKSFISGKFPEYLKIARVTPVFKTGDKKDILNYRSISILAIFSKIYEKIAHIQFLSFISKYKLLHNNHYGFRPKRSTTYYLTIINLYIIALMLEIQLCQYFQILVKLLTA